MSWVITLSFVLSALQLGAAPAAAASPAPGSGFAVSTWASGFSANAVGVAFSPTGALFVTTADGHLWRVAPGGTVKDDLGVIGTDPRGLAVAADGRLYAALYGSGAAGTGGKVVEVQNPAVVPPAALALRDVVARDCANGLSYRAATAGLVVTTCQKIYHVASPATTPSQSTFALVYDTEAVDIASNGKVFVNGRTNATDPCTPPCSSDRKQIWQLEPPPTPPTAVVDIAGTRGIALVGPIAADTGWPRFVFSSTDTGGILKRNVVTGITRPAVTGGDPGRFMTLDSLGCLYATQGTSILRVAKGDLSCDLETAGEATASLTLDPTNLTPNVNTATTVTATLTGVTTDPGTTGPTFTVSGANAGATGTVSLVSSGGGLAKWAFTYTGTSQGPDTIVATMTYGGPLTSNSATVTWQPPPDTTRPLVRAKILSASAPTSPCTVGGVFLDFTSPTTCGFYTTPPTVVWEVIDLESPFLDTNPLGCPPFVVNFPTSPTGQPVTCSATSQGGSTDKTLTLQVALFQPEITVAAATFDGPYLQGVNTRRDVTVTFVCKASYGPPFMTCDAGPGATYGPAVSVPLPTPHVTVTATRTFSGDGVFSATATVSDAAGRSATATFGPILIDQTAPVATATIVTPANAAGWHKADVGVTWSCVDGAGPVLTGCTVDAPATQTVTTEGVNLLTKIARDGVGNVGTGALTVKLDKTAPTVTVSATANGMPYTAGALTRYDVILIFACTDSAGGSGVATCPAPITVTSATPGVSATGADVAGNLSAPATFGPIIIDNVPPTISAAVDRATDRNGWYTAPVTLTFTCSLDAVACPTPIIISTDGAGQTVSATASDLAGNSATATVTGISIDQQKPTITASITPAANPAGWHKTDVVVTFACADQAGLSGVESCLGSTTLGEGTAQSVTGTATDVAGNVRTLTVTNVNVDKTLPTILASADRVPNADGWYGAPVVVTFSCADALSGIASCSLPVTVGHAGGGATGTAVDNAGNPRSITLPLNVDTAAPSGSVSFLGTLADPLRYAISVQVTIAGTDALSGVKGLTYSVATRSYTDAARTVLEPTATTTVPLTSFSGSSTSFTLSAPGESVISFTVTDLAGNTFSGARTVTVVDTIPTTTTLAVRTLRDGKIEATATVKNGTIPVPADLQVIFTTTPLGAGPVTALTNASGIAVAMLARAAGIYQVTATFPQQMPYLTSSATKTAIAAAGTNFVIWGGNPGGVQVGQRVQFWGSDWHKQIADKKSASYKAAGSFKGYAQTVTATTFAATTGMGQREDDDDDNDEKGRKIKELPAAEYITVIITTNVVKHGRIITGNVVGYAVLRVERTKRGTYEERAFGVIVATTY